MRLRLVGISSSLMLGFAVLAAAQSPKSGDAAKLTITVQDGFDGYAGTVDTEVWAVAPNTILDGNINASSDANNDGGESQVLLRFDRIIGVKPNQLPPKSMVHSARVIISAFDEGNTVHLHRMLVPWKASATWNSLVGGVTADGLEAAKKVESLTFGKISASSSSIIFEVTDTVQAWANGEANHGWVFLNTGGNGWDFYTSEFDDKKQRPKLVIDYTARLVTK